MHDQPQDSNGKLPGSDRAAAWLALALHGGWLFALGLVVALVGPSLAPVAALLAIVPMARSIELYAKCYASVRVDQAAQRPAAPWCASCRGPLCRLLGSGA